jgi:hypothetical protein
MVGDGEKNLENRTEQDNSTVYTTFTRDGILQDNIDVLSLLTFDFLAQYYIIVYFDHIAKDFQDRVW